MTFFVILLLALGATSEFTGKLKSAMSEANTLRVIFFAMTFFTIGVRFNVRKTWQGGIGRLAAVYVLCLVGFIIWVGLVISFIVFAGVKPPLVAGQGPFHTRNSYRTIEEAPWNNNRRSARKCRRCPTGLFCLSKRN